MRALALALRGCSAAAAPGAARPLSASAAASSRSAALCAAAEAATLTWVDASVLALNLCPFAHAPRAAGALRCVATPAGGVPALLAALRDELSALAARPAGPPAHTTLLVAPRCAPLRDLRGFLAALAEADAAVEAAGLDGVIQLVGFHPVFAFDGEADGDAAAYTNRAPFPTLHLLRECDVDAALAGLPDAGAAVPARNAAALRALGAPALEARLEALRTAALRSALFADGAAQQPQAPAAGGAG